MSEDEEAEEEQADDKAAPPSAPAFSQSVQRRLPPATIGRIAGEIRGRASAQRRQSVYCLALIAALLMGGGVFFYFAQAIALSELRQQSDFLAKKRASLESDQLKSKQLGDEMAADRRKIADRAPEIIGAKAVTIAQLPSGLQFRRVFFADALHGWAVGQYGTIVSTGDGGATWKIRASGVSDELYDVRFTDVSHGLAVGGNGVILATSDLGATWRKIDTGANVNLYSLRLIDKSRGWAVGAKGAILATLDGGANWSRIESGVDTDLYDVSFADASHGWAVGEKGVVIATLDGGVSWRAGNVGVEAYLVGVHFLDDRHGVVVGARGTIATTSDGGASWRKRDSGVLANLDDVYFTDPMHGFVIGESGTLLATMDGGASWTKRNSGVTVYLHGMNFADPSHGAAVGDDGMVLAITAPQNLDRALAAEHARDLRQALAEAGVDTDDQMIAPYLAKFTAEDSDLREAETRITQDQAELSADLPKDTKDDTAYSLFNNPMFLSNLNRIGITAYAFFAISIVVAIYRYSMRLAAHYDACADAIELSDGAIDGDINQLIQSLSPGKIDFGKVSNPVDRAIDALQSAFRAGKAA